MADFLANKVTLISLKMMEMKADTDMYRLRHSVLFVILVRGDRTDRYKVTGSRVQKGMWLG